ncbi:MAG: hypothetical protein ACXABY_11320 [Candidatus Thorarchaeota archaeon]|jgi:hypothetical protein
MAHGIKKDTYMEADDATTKGLTFDLLNNVSENVDELKGCFRDHLPVCDKRFKTIENKKRKDTAKASAFGFLGGFVAMTGYYIKKLFE